MTTGALLSAQLMVVLVASALASVIAFALYGIDKAAAQRRSRRVSESSLHMWSLLGGWPGAFIAQRAFRHKTRKASFQIVFWISVILNCAGVWWLLSPAEGPTSRSRMQMERPASDLPVIASRGQSHGG